MNFNYYVLWPIGFAIAGWFVYLKTKSGNRDRILRPLAYVLWVVAAGPYAYYGLILLLFALNPKGALGPG